jgi:hypothetical protein
MNWYEQAMAVEQTATIRPIMKASRDEAFWQFATDFADLMGLGVRLCLSDARLRREMVRSS